MSRRLPQPWLEVGLGFAMIVLAESIGLVVTTVFSLQAAVSPETSPWYEIMQRMLIFVPAMASTWHMSAVLRRNCGSRQSQLELCSKLEEMIDEARKANTNEHC